MASLSEIMRQKANAAGSNEPAVSRTRTLSEIMGARSETSMQNNLNAMAQKKWNSMSPALMEESMKQAATDQIGSNLTELGKSMVYTPRYVPGADLVRSSVGVPLSPSTNPIQLAQLKNQAEREKENNVGTIAALGAGGSKSYVAQDAYDAFIRQHIDYNQLLNADDFKQYSQQGAAIQNPTFTDAQKLDIGEYADIVKSGIRSGNPSDIKSFFGSKDNTDKIGNIVTFSRDNIDALYDQMSSDSKGKTLGNVLYSFMKDEEVAIYNYLLAKEGKESAQKYLDHIEEELNKRQGQFIAGNVAKTEDKPLLHAAAAGSVGIGSGVDNAVQGMKQFWNGEKRHSTAPMQFAFQEMQQDQLERGNYLGYAANDVLNTIGNMAPSILVSTVTGIPVLGATTMGISAAGNAYNYALGQGWGKARSSLYGALVGASEGLLQYSLGGINPLGGVRAEKLLTKVASIDNAFLRVAAAWGIKGFSEAFEENVQNFLEPLFRSLLFNEKYDAPTVGEIVYTALISYLTTGMLEGAEIMQYRTQEGARRAAGVNGPVKMENAPAASQTAQETRDPMKVMVDAAQKKQEAEKQNVSDSNTKAETQDMRAKLAEKLESGEITGEQYDAALESISELESIAFEEGESLDTYNPNMMKKTEVNTDGRSNLSDEGSEWAASQSAGEQTGKLAEGARRDQSGQVQNQRAASRRDGVARHYEGTGQQPVNAKEYLGSDSINKVSTLQEVPAEMIANDSELQSIVDDIQSMGLTPHIFVGDVRLTNGNSIDGLIRDNDVFIRADSDAFTAMQNWEHEKAHAIFRQSPGIETELYKKIVGKGEAARRKLNQTIKKYRDAYHGIYDVDQNGNEIWNDEVLDKIMQEVLADAYAGKDTFAQGVEEYTDMSREAASQIEERGGEVRGPPEESFSVKRTRAVPYQKQIDAYYKNDTKVLGRSDDIFVLDATTNLSNLGLGEKPFFMLKSNLTKSVRKEGNNKSNSAHGIEEDVVRDLPDLIKSPALVVIGDGRISVISDVAVDTKNEKNAPLLIGIDPQSSVDGQGAYEIKSIYGRERFSDWLELRAKDSKILAGNANKAAALLRNVGKSYPEPVAYATDLTSWILSQSETPVKGGESFSAGEVAQETSADPIEAMPTKARKIMESAERKLQRSLSDVMNLPKMPDGVMDEVSREISKEFLETGTVSDETIDRTFEKVYSAIEDQVDEQYGVDAEDRRQWAERDYVAEIQKHLAEMRLVSRYANEKAAQSQQNEQDKALTVNDLTRLYKEKKAAQRAADKAVARNLLTESDNQQVNRLLRGDIDLDMLHPGVDNVRGITEVYEAKLEQEKVARQLRRWNAQRKENLRNLADELLATASDWVDKKSGWQYSREPMDRNFFDIIPDEEVAKKVVDTLIAPIHKSAAAATKMKNDYRKRVNKLNLSRKVAEGNKISEAAAVQLLGEAEDNIKHLESNPFLTERDGRTLEDWQGIVRDMWEQNPGLDAAKIRGAVNEFRAIYDELFEQMNEVRMRNGYEPVNYRKGYFPHFQNTEGDTLLAKFGKSLGINTAAMQLPTTINGITHNFKPGIQWFGSAQQRLGSNTVFDAVEGFDSYIEGVADVIHQTDNIQRLRAFASQVRYRTSEEGIRKRVDEIRNDPTIAEEDKHNRIEKIYADGKFELGNLAVELDEYTNLLAGKKSRHDRDMEQRMGRKMYAIMKWAEKQIGANMVAVNPASWLTNFIPIQQAWSVMSTRDLLSGMYDTLRSYKQDDGFAASSAFLTNRRGSDPLVKTWLEQTSGTLSKPMEWIDTFTADTIVRARYNENIRRGLSEDAAMADADAFAASIMADRSKGAMPTIFSQTNPLTKLFTQFQLEVNNQLSFVFKDMPKNTRDKGLKGLALALFKFALGGWLYNELYEWLIGRRPALDPINMVSETVSDIGEHGVYTAGVNLAGSVAEELPFIGGLLGGGRLPISSALPDVGNLWRAISDSNWAPEKRVSTAVKEIAKPATYLALPFGGGQVKKVVEGVSAIAKGGSYSVDRNGEDILQYPVYNSTPGEAGANAVRALLFGKSSLPTAREWVDSGFDSLGAKQTALYDEMREGGASGHDVFEMIRNIEKADTNMDKILEVANSPFDEPLKQLAMANAMTDSQFEKYRAAVAAGVSTVDYVDLLQAIAANAAERESKSASQEDVKKALDASNLTPAQKRAVWESYSWKSKSPW